MNLHVFERFPVLETPRMILRELDPADAEAVFALRADRGHLVYEVVRGA